MIKATQNKDYMTLYKHDKILMTIPNGKSLIISFINNGIQISYKTI
jgi:hypothetical protein